jgi:formylglycine-generating enzyme required for sulfatase activity
VDNKPLAGREQWPVANVTVDDARAFAEWRSKRDGVTYRLPTEEEWEYAARGGDQGNLFPWGNSWAEGRAVMHEASPKAVGSDSEGRTRWGVLDMMGNVWEWTSTKFSLYPGNTQLAGKVPAEQQSWMIKRGGSFASDPADKKFPITNTFRDWLPASTKDRALGFRLVRSGS